MSTETVKRRCEKCGNRFTSPPHDKWKCPKCGTKDFICDDDKPVAPNEPHGMQGIVHPRDIACAMAGQRLWDFMNALTRKYNLTLIERVGMFQKLGELCASTEGDSELEALFESIKPKIRERGFAERAKG